MRDCSGNQTTPSVRVDRGTSIKNTNQVANASSAKLVLTAVFTLAAIYIYSQGQLRTFLFWLIIGIVSGTYSSIFNAAPLLVVWQNREWENWFGRGDDAGDARASAA